MHTITSDRLTHRPTVVGCIVPAVVGDAVHLAGWTPANVVPRCEHERPFHVAVYACLSCRQLLANGYQLTVHTDAGAHVVVRLCPHHGWEPL